MTRPILDQINIVALDFDRTLDFYRLLGLELNEPIRTPAGQPFHVAGKSDQGALLEIDSPDFARVWNSGWAATDELNGRIVVGLKVSDRETVDQAYAAATAQGHRGLQPPVDAFWGARYAILEDPNGVAVGLMSPAEDSHRSSPPTF